MNFIFTGATVVLAASLGVGPAAAQQVSPDEKAIRDLIPADDNGKGGEMSSGSIVWTGALKRPYVIGQGKPESVPGVEGRKGEAIKTTVRRIELSASNDMAYEFSEVELTVTDKSGDKRTFPTSVLRLEEGKQ